MRLISIPTTDGLGIELRKFAIRMPTPSPLWKATRSAALAWAA